MERLRTALKATLLPMLIRERAMVNPAVAMMALTGTLYLTLTRLSQREEGRPLSRLFS